MNRRKWLKTTFVATFAAISAPAVFAKKKAINLKDGLVCYWDHGFCTTSRWDRELSAEEIELLYNKGQGIPYEEWYHVCKVYHKEEMIKTYINGNLVESK